MNNCEHVIIIRFSVRFSNRPEFRNKEDKLFNEDRLKFRFELFEKFCLLGIINQTIKNFKVIIVYDGLLSLKWKNRLIEITKDYDYIILHKWELNNHIQNNNWLRKYIDNNKEYLITTRLDDDDIINKNINKKLFDFLSNLNRKKYNLDGRVITFAGGHFIDYHKDIYKIFPTRRKCLGCYLTLVIKMKRNNNIYSLCHDDIKSRCKIIKFNNCYGVLNHIMENDNRLARYRKKSKTEITYERILEIFIN